METEWESIRQAQARLEQAQRSAMTSRAARLLLDAALVELALGQQPGLFTQEAYPVTFNQAAVVGLKRPGYPWTALLKIAGSPIQPPYPTDPFFVEIQNESTDQLKRRFEALRQRAERLLQERRVEGLGKEVVKCR